MGASRHGTSTASPTRSSSSIDPRHPATKPLLVGSDDDLHALIVAHCRHVETQLPPGNLGVATAAAVIAAVPDAHRRGVPDLTGSAPELLGLLVGYGLLPALPSRRVIRAVPRLLAPLTPIIEARSPRSWALWLSRLADPKFLGKIRRQTPATSLGVKMQPPALVPVRRRRDALALHQRIVRELAAVTEHSRRLEARVAELEERCETLSQGQSGADQVRDKILMEAAAVQHERDRLAQENARQEQVIEDLRLSLQAAESRYQYLKISRKL